jgi:hypothetical protein
MPYFVHAACMTDVVQISEAFTAPSLITVSSMLLVVTQIGVMRTDATSELAVVSFVVPLTRPLGGVCPARRYSASAAAACASIEIGL